MPSGSHAKSQGLTGCGTACSAAPDAIAQSLALLALTFAVTAAPAAAAVTAGARRPAGLRHRRRWEPVPGLGDRPVHPRIAHAGGLYAYTVRGLGPQLGFLAGWMYAIAFAIGISFVLIISADFLSVVLAANTAVHPGWFPLYCILLALILLHRAGRRADLDAGCSWSSPWSASSRSSRPRRGHRGQGRRAGPDLAAVRPAARRPPAHGLALAVILAFTGFIGFEAAAVLGEEAAQPRRVIPRAILGTVILGHHLLRVRDLDPGHRLRRCPASAKWAAEPGRAGHPVRPVRRALVRHAGRHHRGDRRLRRRAGRGAPDRADVVRDGPRRRPAAAVRRDHPRFRSPYVGILGLGGADPGAGRDARPALRRRSPTSR